MKKLLLLATAFACAATCTFAFAACGEDGADKTPEAGHTHTYADAWTYDGNYHWHGANCGHTEEISGKAAHDFTNGDCVCGKTAPAPAAVKMTKEEWDAAFDATRSARNFTCTVNFDEWKFYKNLTTNSVVKDIFKFDYDAGIILLCPEEYVYGEPVYYAYEDGKFYSYTPADIDNSTDWRKADMTVDMKEYLTEVFGETAEDDFKQAFFKAYTEGDCLGYDVADYIGGFIRSACLKEAYADCVFDAATGAYTLSASAVAGMELYYNDGDCYVLPDFDASEMKIYFADGKLRRIEYENNYIIYGGFGTTSVTLPEEVKNAPLIEI